MNDYKLRDFSGAVGIQRWMKLNGELREAALALIQAWEPKQRRDGEPTDSDTLCDAYDALHRIVNELYENE